jgi:hypothetical protein
MRIWKLALAALLAAGVVLAYLYFPNPLAQAERQHAAEEAAKAPAEEHPAAQPSAAEKPVEEAT